MENRMTSEEQHKQRQQAINKVLGTLLHPMKMICVPDREAAYRLAVEYRMTAVDLLNAARGIERAQFTIEGGK